MSPAEILWDTKLDVRGPRVPPDWPRNYDERFHGPQRMRHALANSYNIPAVITLRRIGVPRLLEIMQRFGVDSLGSDAARYGLSLTLGGGDITLLELTQAYGVFANEGARVPLQSIRCVLDSNDDVLYQLGEGCPHGRQTGLSIIQRPLGEQVLDPRIAFIISDILADNEARSPSMGDSSPLARPRPYQRRQNRHHRRRPRQLDRRLHAQCGRGRLGRQQRRPADGGLLRPDRRRAHLERRDERHLRRPGHVGQLRPRRPAAQRHPAAAWRPAGAFQPVQPVCAGGPGHRVLAPQRGVAADQPGRHPGPGQRPLLSPANAGQPGRSVRQRRRAGRNRTRRIPRAGLAHSVGSVRRHPLPGTGQQHTAAAAALLPGAAGAGRGGCLPGGARTALHRPARLRLPAGSH